MASNGFMGFWTRFLSLTNCGRHNELQVISEDYPPIFSDLKILKTSSVSKNSQWFSFRENRNPFKNSGLYLLLVGVVFYTMMACSPLYADDYHDFFLWGTSHRLTTFRDYFHNLYLHYFHESARLIPHCFVELFGVFLGKDVFNVLNTVVFLFFLFLLTKYSITLSPNKESVFPLALCLATCLIFLLMV